MTRHIAGILTVLSISAVAAAQSSHATNRGPLLLGRTSREPFAWATRTSLPPMKESAAGLRYRIVQFEHPLTAAEVTELRSQGIEFLRYVPNNGWLVRQASASRSLAAGDALVFWSDDLRAIDKLDERLLDANSHDVLVKLWEGEPLSTAEDRIRATGARIGAMAASTREPLLALRATAAQLEEVAALGEVEWVEPVPELTLRNDVETAIAQSGELQKHPLWDQGLHGEGEIIGHIDETLDINSCYFRDPVDNTPGPQHRKVVAMRSPSGSPNFHGTHTAGIAAGLRDDLTLAQAGHAYAARLSHSNYAALLPGINLDSPANFDDLKSMLEAARDDGAAIHTNSWGQDNVTNYTYLCAAIDTFMWENEDDLVVFSATNRTVLYTPENARNVLAVGSAKNFPNINDHSSGGMGPTFDGRRKPEIYTIGQSVQSAALASQTTSCGLASQSGTSMAGPNVSGNAALIRQYFREGFYPSGARTPEAGFVPSGVLLKAALLNAAVDMTGVEGYPSDLEGWGRLVTDRVLHFAGDSRTLFIADERASANRGLTTGEVREYLILVEPGEDFRATLVWNDPPVAHNALLAAVNDLNLVVVAPDGSQYHGNDFALGQSRIGTTTDSINNVEQVALPTPAAGFYRIRVEGGSVQAPTGPAGYALVATGAVRELGTRGAVSIDRAFYKCDDIASIVVGDGNVESDSVVVTVTADGGDSETLTLDHHGSGLFGASVPLTRGVGTSGNGIVELPGNGFVAVSYVDSDTGAGSETLTTTAQLDCAPPMLTAPEITGQFPNTLLVLATSDEPSTMTLTVRDGDGVETEHPMLPTNTESTIFRVSAEDLDPGTFYTLTTTAQDRAGNRATSAETRTATLLAEPVFFADFEEDEDGFTSDTLANQDGWVRTETEFVRSGRFAFFVNNSQTQQDARLNAPVVTVPNDPRAVLTFWHTFEFEPDTATTGWDGGVLEFREAGTLEWVDAGPFFKSGGYTGTIKENPNSVISTRPAWVNGRLGKPTFVAMTLADYAGKNVELRWRIGSDAAARAQGWYIDDVFLGTLVNPTEPTFTATPTPTPSPTVTPTPTPEFTSAYYGFDAGPEGWAFLSPVEFARAQGSYAPDGGALAITTTSNNVSFAFWDSPVVPENGAEGLLRVTTRVVSSESSATAPTVRLRVSKTDFSRSDVIVATSTGEGTISPRAEGVLYTLYAPRREYVGDNRVSFDVLNADQADAANATVQFDYLLVEALPTSVLGLSSQIYRVDFFGGEQSGFTPRDAFPLHAPEFSSADGLRMATGSDPGAITFGFWGSETDIAMKQGRLYRITWDVEGEAAAEAVARVPVVRLRVNDSSLAFSAYVNLDSRNDASIALPNFTTRDLWFATPLNLGEQTMILSFDYLYVPGTGDDATIPVKLNSLVIQEYFAP